MQRGRESGRKGGVSVLRGNAKRNEGGIRQLGRETSPAGSAGTGCVHDCVDQNGIQRMNLVRLAFRHLSRAVTSSAAPGSTAV